MNLTDLKQFSTKKLTEMAVEAGVELRARIRKQDLIFNILKQQAKKGVWDFKLKAVYCIGILDFVFSEHKDLKDVIHTVQLKNQHNHLFYDKLKFIYIEMPHFDKTLEQLEYHCDRWLYFIKNLLFKCTII